MTLLSPKSGKGSVVVWLILTQSGHSVRSQRQRQSAKFGSQLLGLSAVSSSCLPPAMPAVCPNVKSIKPVVYVTWFQYPEMPRNMFGLNVWRRYVGLLVESPGRHQAIAMPRVQDRPRHLRTFLGIGRVNCVTLVQHSVQYCAAERAAYLAKGHLLLIQKGLHHAQFPYATFLPLW